MSGLPTIPSCSYRTQAHPPVPADVMICAADAAEVSSDNMMATSAFMIYLMHGGRTMKKYSEAFIGFNTAKKKHAVAIADVRLAPGN
jgi:hypothetical protein